MSARPALPYDLHTALAAVNGQIDLLRTIADSFVPDTARRLAEMHAALDAGDYDAVWTHCHSLSGSGSYLRAEPFCEAARLLKEAVGAKKQDPLTPLLDALEKQYLAIRERIEQPDWPNCDLGRSATQDG